MPRKPVFARRRRPVGLNGNKRALERFEAKQIAGFEADLSRRVIPRFEDTRYAVHPTSLIGEAPKNFVSVHIPGRSKRHIPETWPQFIAKVGHKRYPTESITEHLLTRIGECFGLDMARSRLMTFGGQVRFLSEYFLGPDEILWHGAQLVSAYLQDPDFEEFAGHVRQAKLEAEIFTFNTLAKAIGTRFPSAGSNLVDGLVRVIGYDSLVGNHDRHLYNWGVITGARSDQGPRFAPIFDTARALFWNEAEHELADRNNQSVEAYVQRSKPVIGVEGNRGINHFSLMYAVAIEHPRYVEVLRELKNESALADTLDMVDREFADLLSAPRREKIKQCLRLRFDRYCKVLNEC